MSQTTVGSFNHKLDRAEWLELEVPYGLINDNWEEEYQPRLERYVLDSYKVSRNLLNLYWCTFADLDEVPYERRPLLTDILDTDPDYGKNILAIWRFANGLNLKRLKSVFTDIESEITDPDLSRIYEEALDTDDKDAQVGLILFTDQERLRDVRGLQYCYGRVPQLKRKSKNKFVDVGELDVEEIEEELQNGQSEEHKFWHKFNHGDESYILIKRQLGDGVERQVEINLEEEPAEFVVARFSGKELQIYSEERERAQSTLDAINKQIEQKYREESDDSEDIEEEIEKRQFDEDNNEKYTYEELEAAVGLAKELDKNTEITLKGINVKSTDLPKNPEMRLKTDRGIGKSLTWFEERNINLLNRPDDVDSLTFRYEGRDFSLLPRESPEDSEESWLFKYNANYPDEIELKKFEEHISDYMDVEVRFEKT